MPATVFTLAEQLRHVRSKAMLADTIFLLEQAALALEENRTDCCCFALIKGKDALEDTLTDPTTERHLHCEDLLEKVDILLSTVYEADAFAFNGLHYTSGGSLAAYWYGDRADPECREARILGLMFLIHLIRDV